MMAARGLPVETLFTEADIDLASLRRAPCRIDVDRVSRLWERAICRSGQTTLGLDRQLAVRHGNVDLVGHALASAPTPLTGFQHLTRQMALISDATTFAFEHEERGCWLTLDHVGATRSVPRQRIEFSLLTLLTFSGWLTRRPVRPLAVELSHPQPAVLHEPDYLTAFALSPRYGCRANRILLSHTDLRATIPSHNPALWDLHGRLVQDELDQLGQTSVSVCVRQALLRLLPRGEPRRADVAAQLAMSDRTLQRRLQAEAVNFQHLLDDTRRHLARQHLGESRHSLTEVADLLGFADTSNFFRACKRWFGLPPSQYRQQLQAQEAHGSA